MKNFEIHRATVDDADDIGYVHAKSWQSAYEKILPKEFLIDFTPQKRSEFFKRIIPIRPEEYYIGYLGYNPIGMLIIGKTVDEDVKPNIGEIMALYLLEEYWGKGYGKSLMEFGIKRLSELSYNDIILWVLEDNKRARNFYEKYGFFFDGTKRKICIGKPFMEVRYIHGIKRVTIQQA